MVNIITSLVRELIRDQREYPLPAFYFSVTLSSEFGPGDSSFQEVSGIESEIKTEDVQEGGENLFVHKLPKSIEHPLLVMKRGIAKKDSPLFKWCKSVLEDFEMPIKTGKIDVHLLDENANPARSWSFANAYPVKWEVEAFNSTKNEVAIETIHFAYTYSNRSA